MDDANALTHSIALIVAKRMETSFVGQSVGDVAAAMKLAVEFDLFRGKAGFGQTTHHGRTHSWQSISKKHS